jgi:Tfp pilus assembly protein PilO
MTTNISGARRLLIGVAIVLLILSAGAVAVLLSPVGRGRSAREQEYNQVRQEYQSKLREEGPARDIDQRLANARKQTDRFYQERILSRYADIADTIGRLASENHVQVTSIHYDAKDTDIAGLQQISIGTQITGDYNNQMRFINALERSKPFFMIDSVNLAGSESGGVRLDMKLETFKRGGA